MNGKLRQQALGWTAAALLLLVLLPACGGGSRAQKAADLDAAGAGSVSVQPAPASESVTQASPGSEQHAAADQVTSGSGGSEALPVGLSELDPSFGRKIIMNADISLHVADAGKARIALQRLADASRGYVANSTLSGSDEDGWTARVVLRIPQSQFSSVYNEIAKLGEMGEERQWTDDVTDEFVDLESRLKILRMHEQTLLELQSRANAFEEWERLQSRLMDVRIQIEQIQGRLRVLSNQVDFATINVSLYQPPVGAPAPEQKPVTLGQRMAEAFKDSAKAVWAFAEAMLVFLAAFLPVLGFLTVVGVLVYLLVRVFRRQRAPVGPTEQP